MTDKKCQDANVFGVLISSRYGVSSEMWEMFHFIKGLRREYPECLEAIESVSCDSKCGQVDIELREEDAPSDQTELRGFCRYLAEFYYEETKSARVILIQSGANAFEETPDFDIPGEDYDPAPPGTVFH